MEGIMNHQNKKEPQVKLRVLAVDDQEEWGDYIKGALEADGNFQVDSVTNITDANAKMKTHWYHILCLDVHMDENDKKHNKDGLMFLNDLYDDNWVNRAGMVVMLSSTDVIDNVQYAHNYGIAKFFSKGKFSPHQFPSELYELFISKIRWNNSLEINFADEEDRLFLLEVDGKRLKNADPNLVQRIRDERDDLFRRLYHNATKILVTHLTPGKSGTLVAQVQPFYENGAGRQSVMKYGEYVRIQEEIDNYNQYVKDFSPGSLSTQLISQAYTPKLGGIVYSHLGANKLTSSNFGEYYAEKGAGEINNLLDYLFNRVCADWYSNRQPRQLLNLTQAYRETLGFTKENLQKALDERLRTVQGKDKLTFNNLPEVKDLPNPLLIADKVFMRSCYTSISHGDLNENNILVDENNHSWLIDFRRTYESHILRDLVFLEMIIRIQLLSENDATLEERYILEKKLCNLSLAKDLTQLKASYITSNPALNKAFQVSLYLRQLANQLSAPSPDGIAEEYFIGLFFTSLNIIRYYEISRVQREHAILMASLLAEALI
jgi:CheY-like chemotaxis protein